MTPKEKAEELYNKFDTFTIDYDDNKRIALLCVDEILESNEKISLKELRETLETNDILCQLSDNAMYWQEVKQEIEKL